MATTLSAPLQLSRHIESLDGIRGIAILMVLLLHADWFNNGWIGVDLFFVLSGFLITGILRRSKTEPFYWRRFYLKRVTRILPPVVLGVAVTAFLWPHTSIIGLAGYLFSLGNFVDITHFTIRPIGHLWSLSVEEHYYLFWPLAVIRLRRETLLRVLVGIVLMVPLARFGFTFLLPRSGPNPIYHLTPFRIDGIALGSMLSLLLEERQWQDRLKKWSAAGAVVASATYLLLWTALGHIHFFPDAFNPVFNGIGYSLVAVVAFFVVAFAYLRPDAIVTRVLCSRPLVKLGEISYGLYVYSWILLQLIIHYLPGLSPVKTNLLYLFASLPLSGVLYKYYERPITLWGKRRAARLARNTNVAVAGDSRAQRSMRLRLDDSTEPA